MLSSNRLLANTRSLSEMSNVVHTHESGRIRGVRSNFSIDLDQPLFDDTFDLIPSKGILQTVPQEHNEGDAFSLFVWTRRGFRCLQQNGTHENICCCQITASPRDLRISLRVCQASNAWGHSASSSVSWALSPEKENNGECVDKLTLTY